MTSTKRKVSECWHYIKVPYGWVSIQADCDIKFTASRDARLPVEYADMLPAGVVSTNFFGTKIRYLMVRSWDRAGTIKVWWQT